MKRGFSANVFALFVPRKSGIRNKAPPPIIYPSGCQASFGGAVNTAVFPCLSSLQTATKPPSVWRRTVKIQSLQWHALWIYTGEFITWLAISALFIQRRKQNRNLNADDVVSGGVWQRSLHNTLVKAPLQAAGGTKDVRRPHYWTRCICWTLTVEKNEMSLSCPLFFIYLFFCVYLFINKSISK